MADTTEISWCDSTFNGWEGCTNISPGCDNCYAQNRNNRFSKGKNWGEGAPRRRTSEKNWGKPIKWNDEDFYQCDACGWRGSDSEYEKMRVELGISECCESPKLHLARRRVFCASLSDVFDNEVDPQWRKDLWMLITTTPNLDWLLLTKRIGNVMGMVPNAWRVGYWPKNVWLGETIVNPEEAERDIYKLMMIPAVVRFLSMEPLLAAVDLKNIRHPLRAKGNDWITLRVLASHLRDNGIHWVIVGFETGPGARPGQTEWAESLRDQCRESGTPFFMKQMGGPMKNKMPPIPDDLLVREFPA